MFPPGSEVVSLKATQFMPSGDKIKVKKSGAILIYSSTCPYCIMVKEEWGKLSKNGDYNAYAFQSNEYGNEEVVEKLAEKLGFNSVPSIFMVKNGTIQKKLYDGERTSEKILSHMRKSLGAKKAPKKKVSKKSVSKKKKVVKKKKVSKK